jgi:hypothetical protein
MTLTAGWQQQQWWEYMVLAMGVAVDGIKGGGGYTQ